tara:strand:- start:88 stop:459 length:372 start_codon:yes stop_codon:yes gene_type:complete
MATRATHQSRPILLVVVVVVVVVVSRRRRHSPPRLSILSHAFPRAPPSRLPTATRVIVADVIAAAIDRVVVRARRPRARRALASASTEARARARAEGLFPPFTTHNAHSRMPSDAIKCETAKG